MKEMTETYLEHHATKLCREQDLLSFADERVNDKVLPHICNHMLLVWLNQYFALTEPCACDEIDGRYGCICDPTGTRSLGSTGHIFAQSAAGQSVQMTVVPDRNENECGQGHCSAPGHAPELGH